MRLSGGTENPVGRGHHVVSRSKDFLGIPFFRVAIADGMCVTDEGDAFFLGKGKVRLYG